MNSYILKRLAAMALNLTLVSIFVFFMLRFVPGDVAVEVLGQDVSEERYEEFREENGLNGSAVEQYTRWARGAIQGDFGTSLRSGFNVSDELVKRIPVSVEVMLFAFTFTSIIGVTFGILSAVKQNSKWDYGARLLSIMGLAVPSFVLLTLLLIMPARQWGYAPPFGSTSFMESPWDNLRLFVPPTLMLSFGSSAALMRLTRTAFLDVLRQDYMRTARAKGLAGRTVIWGHGFRNVAVPIATVMGLQFTNLLGGSVILESIMGLPGVGTWALTGIQANDYPVVMAFSLYVAVLVMSVSLFIDLLSAVIDPRIRYS